MDVTKRFEGRADDYDRARPHYPRAAIDHIRSVVQPTPEDLVVDLGAGTGLLAIGFIDCGDRVTLVEPSQDMADMARARFGTRATVIEARAEATTLEDASAKLVVAGQAFHWFDSRKTAIELRRILKPNGFVSLVWNQRRLSGEPFLDAYESFLNRWGTDYAKVAATYQSREDMQAVFGVVPSPVMFDNRQVLDRDGLRSRILSCSYIPGPGHASFDSMTVAIDVLFDAHAHAGTVTLVYDTTVYLGVLS